jgi:NAD(P)-dependent dehydrogenase (short-subunit alcohol dehydrogenase family)
MLRPVITRQGTRFHQSLRKPFSTGGTDKTPIKHVIITGASGGIGRAIASRFALEGAKCTLIGRTESKLQASLRELSALRDHRIVVGDVGKEAFWKDLAKKMVSGNEWADGICADVM